MAGSTRVWKGMLLAAVALALAAALLLRMLAVGMDAPSPAPEGTLLTVRAGTSLRGVLAELARIGVLRHPAQVEWYLRLHGEHPRVQSGTYALGGGETVRQIINQLNAGQVVLAQVTIVEGWTFAQMRLALDASPDLVHELRTLSDAALMKALGQDGVPAEGRFFPDTYRFAGGTSDRRIYELALQRMSEHLQQEWQARAGGLPVADPTAALILASIVEKETGRVDERGKVAAVFTNRLRIGMRLQSDPTVIYGLGERYDGNLRRRDLEADGPFNSYTRAGLPPTPIALPGAASLHAALHPEPVGALYFVATGLGDGSHHFSDTYAEHTAALLRFLRRTGAKPDSAVTGGLQ